MDPFYPEFLFGATCPWRIWRRDLVPIFLLSVEQTFSDEYLETHSPIVRTPFINQLILSHHLCLTSCWASPPPLHVGIDMCRHVCILSQACNYDTREGANSYMTGFLHFLHQHGILCSFYLKGFLLWGLNLWRVSFRHSVPSLLVRERTIVLLLSEPRICFQMPDHGVNYTSLLTNIVQLLSTGSILSLSSLRWLSSLFDSWLLLLSQLFLSRLWSSLSSLSDEYDVLLMFSSLE